MNHQEAVILLRAVAAACPQQVIDEYTPDAWHDLLGDLDFGECRAAVIAVGRRQPFIAPAEVRAEVRRVRAERLSRAVPPAPDHELADQPGRYKTAIQAGVKRIADGFAMPKAITGAPERPFTDIRPSKPEPDPREKARQQAAEARAARLARETGESAPIEGGDAA